MGPCLRRLNRAYPRVRGGIGVLFLDMDAFGGLSPRARGNLLQIGRLDAFNGSIPACAGESWRLSSLNAMQRVYPRVRGGIR